MKGMNDVMAKRNGSRWPLAVITLAIALAGADMAAAGSLTNTAVANGRPARGGFTAPSAQVSVPIAPCRERVSASSGDEARGATRRRMQPALRALPDPVASSPCASGDPERTAATGM